MHRVQPAVLSLLLFIVGARDVIASDTRQVGERLQQLLAERKSVPSSKANTARIVKLNASLKAELAAASELDIAGQSCADLATIAECYFVCNRYPECTRYAEAALQQDSSHELAHSLRVRSLVFLKRLADAAVALEFAEKHVSVGSNVQSLHCLIYFQAAASKDWTLAVPHIERHLDYLAQVAITQPEDAVRSSVWVDQLVLAYKKGILESTQRQQQIDAKWQMLMDLKPALDPPRNTPRIRQLCAVLELQSAIQRHTDCPTTRDCLLEWISAIAHSEGCLTEEELVNEASILCRFLHEHSRDIAVENRASVIEGLMEIENTAAFRVVPSSRIVGLRTMLERARREFEADDSKINRS